MELEWVLSNCIEVKLKESEDFLKIKETLTRMGVASDSRRILWQSCHILHKKGRYYICHFKEMFMLDMKESTLTEEDVARRNTIARVLHEWGLLEILNMSQIETPRLPMSGIKILPHKEKNSWQLMPKYNIGVKQYAK